MAWMNTTSPHRNGPFGPLLSYVNSYRDQAKKQGFASGSITEQVCVLKLLGLWLQRTNRKLAHLNEQTGELFVRRALRRGYPRNAAKSTLRRLLQMLRRDGVIPAAKPLPPTPSGRLVNAYMRFLLEERKLAAQTVATQQRFASQFMAERFGTGPVALAKLHAQDVTAFVQRHAHRHGPAYASYLVTAVRSFLRYLHYRGLVAADLSLAVPKVARWSLSTVPKHLPAAQVRQLLRSCDMTTPLGRRDYSILLLLARLGLRAGEVVRLELADIDCENARISVCGKGGRWAQLPLPADVTKAMARYLLEDRPRCVCRRVFLRDYAPTGGFQDAHAVSSIVKRALARAGVVSARKGAHLLRHSLATEMLRKGVSLDDIGEVLRHRSPDTTAIYAKVDLKSLRALALPWPGGVR
jgi:site-specific recombinase XerD